MSDFTKKGEQYLKHLKEKIDPKDIGSFERIVAAGQKVMFSEKTHQYMLGFIEKDGDLGENIGVGVVELLGLLMSESKGNLPPQLLIPAGSVFAMKACEFAERTGEKVTMETFTTAVKIMIAGLKRNLDKGGDPQPQQPSAPAIPAPGGMLAQGA